jgi:gas vesicle protein GvpN
MTNVMKTQWSHLKMKEKKTGTMSETTVRVQTQGDSVLPEASEEFVITPYVQAVSERALTYLSVGYAVHLSGPAGVGKTTLAFHVASQIGRPVALIHGDDEFGSSDLVGRDSGYRKSKLVDNYIHSVLRTEEEMKTLWVDNRLTTACERGHTLIYDEFTRSRPEANNILLSVLGEGILNLPELRVSGDGYVAVHNNFRAIFTSNPEEYAGTHKTQDALMDRLITIKLDHYDRKTEIRITMAKSGIKHKDAEIIVDIIRELRNVGVNNHLPTIRSCIAIAKVLAFRKARAWSDDKIFNLVCRDVLNVETAKVTRGGQSLMPRKVDEAIEKVCGRPAANDKKLKKVMQRTPLPSAG